MSSFDQAHPLYPIAWWLPYIGKKISEIPGHPFFENYTEQAREQTLDFSLLAMAARDHLCELYGNMEDDDTDLSKKMSDDERDFDLESQWKLIRDFSNKVVNFTVGEMIVRLCTNVVYHQIHLDDEERRSNFHNDFVVLYPSWKKDFDSDAHVVKQMNDYFSRPIMKQCTSNDRSYFYEGVSELKLGRCEVYINFHWGS